MIDTHKLKKRDLYLNKIIAFQDTEPVKVVTGIRRCGKSSLLKLMVLHLKESGITDEQILEMNFESHAFKNMNSDSFYEYVKQHIVPNKRMYLFFDEVQRVPNWEDAVNSFRVDFNCDIYVTGSNAYMLSSEYATYLSGRCVEIKMLPLSFSEFLTFHGFEVREIKSSLGGIRKQAFDKNDERYELRDVFDAYMRFGGMPGIADIGLDQEKALMLLEGIYSTVIMRDILERENRKGQSRITDPVLLKKIIMFLADNIGSNISVSSIGNTLMNEGLLDNGKRKGTPSVHTVQSYINALLESYFFYEIKRFDIKGKEFLRTLGKYYIVDIGLRNYLLGFRNRDSGHALENIVYFELLRRGYDVSIGKIDNSEVDFIATKADNKIYVQVTESMTSEDVRKRELSPLQKISDNYEKIILSLNPGMDSSYNGIKSINLIDWLISE
ncbi:ATP-binding protein [Dorea formicigenerans]|uniref:ATP-binding protein n=1 Tax=Dorea formicigenerans TaxID=39486 RepID=A0A3E4F7D9_9FIRM|nr:ATP-binding protein [Dorea formicigenerans]RGI84929.1 ATP-binding protein [Dorea formicigenerans]RGI88640.1 ATP-binding protein [Dorea formicigenerans]RGT06880.1 ATP-binding protein [Dorea formicigenerans]RHA00429.1 ATP-binding protein [Dorea formicigenerans]RHC11003.1 ATP-binding protein [Dorea formicigenerans]